MYDVFPSWPRSHTGHVVERYIGRALVSGNSNEHTPLPASLDMTLDPTGDWAEKELSSLHGVTITLEKTQSFVDSNRIPIYYISDEQPDREIRHDVMPDVSSTSHNLHPIIWVYYYY